APRRSASATSASPMPRLAPVIRTVLPSSVVPSFISTPPRSFLIRRARGTARDGGVRDRPVAGAPCREALQTGRRLRVERANGAAGLGFEPRGRSHAQRFSRPPHSAALAPRRSTIVAGAVAAPLRLAHQPSA